MTDEQKNPIPVMTQDQADKYIADILSGDGANCPFCGGDQIEGGSFDLDSGCVYQHITCLSCQRSWTDSYTLDGISADVPTDIGGVEGAEPGQWFYRGEKRPEINIELLAACESLVCDIEAREERTGIPQMGPSIHKARAVIAKAEKKNPRPLAEA